VLGNSASTVGSAAGAAQGTAQGAQQNAGAFEPPAASFNGNANAAAQAEFGGSSATVSSPNNNAAQ
jgi:hypothetical protein